MKAHWRVVANPGRRDFRAELVDARGRVHARTGDFSRARDATRKVGTVLKVAVAAREVRGPRR